MLVTAAMACLAAPAYGYQDEVEDLTTIPMAREFMADPDDPGTWTVPDPMPCYFCHGTETVTGADIGRGPHGGYLTTTNKCATCHAVHAAPAGALLLPAATVKATCEVCHDGTGGDGVYGAILASTGLDPAVTGAVHSIDQTNVIPGGDAATGDADATRAFFGTDGNLTCTDCHSPHGNGVVNDFTGDRDRATSSTPATSRLLRQLPSTATTPVVEYGSDWCGGCHTGRMSGSGPVGNHPVESAANPPDSGVGDMFYYDRVARVSGVNVSTTVIGSLGGSNFGYVMPDPLSGRTPEQTGHTPICMQCHEDARDVGDVNDRQVDTTEVFAPSLDGVTPGNPRFQNFPHEAQNPFFLVETEDDLCLNCHDTAAID